MHCIKVARNENSNWLYGGVCVSAWDKMLIIIVLALSNYGHIFHFRLGRRWPGCPGYKHLEFLSLGSSAFKCHVILWTALYTNVKRTSTQWYIFYNLDQQLICKRHQRMEKHRWTNMCPWRRMRWVRLVFCYPSPPRRFHGCTSLWTVNARQGKLFFAGSRVQRRQIWQISRYLE